MFNRQFRLPFSRRIESAINSLSLTGKVFLGILVLIFTLSAFAMLWHVNNEFLVEVPRRGGTLVEGVIGLPRYINPILSVTDGDKDLSALVYSGLMKVGPEGNFIPDLAESFTISPDGKTYTFSIKKQAVFHDGTPVTADDVVFTIQKVQDPALKSNKRAHWDGVVVEKINDHEVRFVLKEPFATFIENTTLGILPKALWQNLSGEDFIASETNINPIGSGPFKISSIERNNSGIVTSYTLAAFSDYVSGQPYISEVITKFYTSEKALIDAYNAGDVDHINSISSENALALKKDGAKIIQGTLPRVFAIFFNQSNSPALAEKEVRQALSMSVNRDALVNEILNSFATPLDKPVPKSFTNSVDSSSTPAFNTLEAANKLLDDKGWTLNSTGIREKKVGKDTITLSFSISTSDAAELKNVAEMVKNQWQKLGADVSVKVVEGGYLNQNVIMPRKYDALLFGQVINRELDLFAFWHSSQKDDPGLNVARYSNVLADKELETLRTTSDDNVRNASYVKLEQQIDKDIPAIFLYSPSFIYVVSPKISGMPAIQVSQPSERLSTISNWYRETEHVWKIFFNQ